MIAPLSDKLQFVVLVCTFLTGISADKVAE